MIEVALTDPAGVTISAVRRKVEVEGILAPWCEKHMRGLWYLDVDYMAGVVEITGLFDNSKDAVLFKLLAESLV